MAVKTITITEDAYEALKRMKRDDESFSELFLRLSGRTLLVKDIIGILKNDAGADAWRERVIASRERLNTDLERRAGNVRARLKRPD